jgi:hypothetical protein
VRFGQVAKGFGQVANWRMDVSACREAGWCKVAKAANVFALLFILREVDVLPRRERRVRDVAGDCGVAHKCSQIVTNGVYMARCSLL